MSISRDSRHKRSASGGELIWLVSKPTPLDFLPLLTTISSRSSTRSLPQEAQKLSRPGKCCHEARCEASAAGPRAWWKHQVPRSPPRGRQLRLGFGACHTQDPPHRRRLQLDEQRARPDQHAREERYPSDRRRPLPPMVRGALWPACDEAWQGAPRAPPGCKDAD